MTHSDKVSFQEELEQNIDVFSEEFEGTLQIGDFDWVERIKPKIMQEKDCKEQSEIITTSIAMVAPYESFTESSGEAVHPQTEYINEEKTNREAVVTSDLDEELLVEQNYWDKYGSVAKKMNNIKSKYPISKTRTSKEHIKNKSIAQITSKHPSYYQCDKETTAILEKFQKGKYVGSFQNVVGKGLNSVVIYSTALQSRVYSPNNSLAIKVYKLSEDERKNSTILNRAQKEFEHLKILRYAGGKYGAFVPFCVYTYKNVTILSFIGHDQQTAPSIKSLPLEHSKQAYETMVMWLRILYKNQIVHAKLSSKYIRIWYNKPYILGWSHSVRTDHPQALKKLMRDCHFVTKFFERRDVQVKSTLELFEETMCEKISRDLLFYGRSLWQQDQHQTNPNRTEDTCRPHGRCRFK